MLEFISDNEAPCRIDAYLAKKIPSLSRSSIKKLIETGNVKLEGSNVNPKQKIIFGAQIAVDFDPKHLDEIPDIDLPIIYEDNGVIVIDKPAGILTHSKGVFNPEATVASFIAPRLAEYSGERAGIVHRLDRGTSGVIICAKNQEAQKFLQKQFAQRRTKKTYITLVSGYVEPAEAIIDGPIERNPKKPQTFRVGANGKPATTNYKVLDYSNDVTKVELRPTTGRTHQLRVHMASIGHSIVGDTMYGGIEASRMMLHAYQLEITLPSRQRVTFTANIPSSFHV